MVSEIQCTKQSRLLTSLDIGCTDLGGDFLKHLRNLPLLLRALPLSRHQRPSYGAAIPHCQYISENNFRCMKGQGLYTPFSPVWARSNSSASVLIFPPARTFHGASAMPSARAIGMDVALKVALKHTPSAFVNHERCAVAHAGVAVCAGDDPGGSVRDSLGSDTRMSRCEW